MQSEVINPNFGINSKVFYPSYGAGEIVREKKIEFGGESKKYYEFEFLNKNLTISTPVHNIDMLGIRHVLTYDQIKDMIKVLKSKKAVDPKVKDYNELMNLLDELDRQGTVPAFVQIIQYSNFEKKTREKEGRLIPISITRHIKGSINHIISEMAVSQDISYDKASEQFRKITGIDPDNL